MSTGAATETHQEWLALKINNNGATAFKTAAWVNAWKSSCSVTQLILSMLPSKVSFPWAERTSKQHLNSRAPTNKCISQRRQEYRQNQCKLCFILRRSNYPTHCTALTLLLIGPRWLLTNLTGYVLQYVIDTGTHHSWTWICLSNLAPRVCGSSPSGSLVSTFSSSWASESSASGSPWYAFMPGCASTRCRTSNFLIGVRFINLCIS